MLAVRNNLRGFTMIELMIGVVILAILFSVAAPSFSSWIQNAQLRTAAESISNGLQLARTEAVRRNTSVIFTLNGTPKADSTLDSTWTIGCVVPVTTLDVDGNETCPAVIQSHSGSEGTSNASVASNKPDIKFNGLGRASDILIVNVINTTGGACQIANGPMRCLNILVASGGQIRMCNPALSNTNPQGC